MLDVLAVDHVGVRVTDGERAIAFYAHLGFSVVARHDGPGVIILRHPRGIELNLIVNAQPSEVQNVLLDAPIKHAGLTHLALRVQDVGAALVRARSLGLHVTEGPVQLGDGQSIFVRDPDGNVIELRSPLT